MSETFVAINRILMQH